MSNGAEIPAPEINPKTVLTRTRGSRLHRPFVVKNGNDLDAKMSQSCPRCGYKGPAMRVHMPEGVRGPATLVHSSRASFLRAFLAATFMCENCVIDLHGRPVRVGKKRAATWGISLSNTLAALAADDTLS